MHEESDRRAREREDAEKASSVRVYLMADRGDGKGFRVQSHWTCPPEVRPTEDTIRGWTRAGVPWFLVEAESTDAARAVIGFPAVSRYVDRALYRLPGGALCVATFDGPAGLVGRVLASGGQS